MSGSSKRPARPPNPWGRRSQDRIRASLNQITTRLDNLTSTYAEARTGLDQLTELLVDLGDLYNKCEPAEQRILNHALFTRITIDDEQATYTPDETTASVLAHTTINAPVDVTAETKLPRHQAGQVSIFSSYVELGGFEPPTSSMPWKRATNCAIAPSGSSPISDADNSMESRAAGANLPRVRYLTSPRALLIHGVGVSTGGRSGASRPASPDAAGSGRVCALPRCQVPPHQHPPRLPPT